VSAIAAGYDTPRRIIAIIKADGTQTVYVDGTAGGTTYSGGAFVSNGILAMGNTGCGGFSGQGNWSGATTGTGKISEIGVATGDNTALVSALDSYLQAKWVYDYDNERGQSRQTMYNRPKPDPRYSSAVPLAQASLRSRSRFREEVSSIGPTRNTSQFRGNDFP
jgi:hypothetical protein